MSSDTPPLSLGGSLADFALADILMLLNMGRKTGAIEVKSGLVSDRIYLAGGEVIHASSKNPRLKLPAFLEARGHLTQAQALELERRAGAESLPFRELAIATGVLSGADMASVEKVLCSEILFEALGWKNGQFAFLKDRRPREAFTELKIDLQNLILEGARREDEARRLGREARIDRSLVVTLVCAAGRLEEQVVLTPEEWGLVSLINGKRTIDEIFSLSPVGSEEGSWRILQRLHSARLIQIQPRDATLGGGRVEEGLEGAYDIRPTAEISRYRPVESEAVTAPIRRESSTSYEATDVKLISGAEVTTSHGMYGQRVPARLVGTSDSADPSAAFELTRPILTIGRSDSNDVVLPHGSVSKQHALLVQDGEGWSLSDLKSTNGTRVNEARIGETRLEPGDRVQIGVYAFHFDAVTLRPHRQ